MLNYKNQICLISGQNTPSLLGALMSEKEKPKIYALVTERMREQANIFKKTCEGRGMECELRDLPRIDDGEIEKVLDEIWLASENETWAVNITGGTKLMAIAAFGWATANKIAAFYVDTESRKIFFHENRKWTAIPLPELADYKTLINLYGYTIIDKLDDPVDRETRIAIDALLSRTVANAKVFHGLNKIASDASAQKDLTAHCFMSKDMRAVLDICKKVQKLDFTDKYVLFKDKTALNWCKGRWLEEHVRATLARLKEDGFINSWASGVKIDKTGENELDAVFTADNILYVIECKTSKMKDKADDALYKADSIRGRVAGIFTKTLICSIDELSPANSSRAKGMGIRVLRGADLKNLRKFIIEWINKDERN